MIWPMFMVAFGVAFEFNLMVIAAINCPVWAAIGVAAWVVLLLSKTLPQALELLAPQQGSGR